jgi:hypothetical protein
MLNRLIGNWQTSAIGVVMAAFQLYQNGMNWKSALTSALMAALGIAAKDASVGSAAK